MLPMLSETSYAFPPLDCALDGGLLAFGGDLHPHRLLSAYSQGIFPWYGADSPLLWWAPDPRCILPLDAVHVPKRLARRWRAQEYSFRWDTAFTEVMRHCAAVPRSGQDSTWILPEMIEAYTVLHRMGYAHSMEAWREGRLVAGMYGVALGRAFFGESMFTLEPDASKLTLLALVERLRVAEFQLLDCQQYTAHMARFGALEISRKEFMRRLKRALQPAPARSLSKHTGSAGMPELP